LSDVVGKSGTRILQALAAGETDPEHLLAHVDRRRATTSLWTHTSRGNSASA
jgi:hypothetical protein